MIHRPTTAFALLGLLASALLVAPTAAQQLLVRNYTEAGGLPSSGVHDVRPAPDGLLWFATRAGLHTYDGTSWTRVHHTAVTSVREARFVRFDGAGEAWILRNDGFVLHGRAGELAHLPRYRDGYATGFLHEFEVLDAAGGTVVAVRTARLGLLVWDGKRWSAIATGAAGAAILTVEPCFGAFLVGTEAGLFAIDGERLEPAFPDVPDSLPAGRIRGLARERVGDDERLWVLGADWVGTVDRTGTFALVAQDIPLLSTHDTAPAVAMTGDGAGGVLYGNPWALYHVHGSGGTFRRLNRSSGLVGDGVNALIRDAEGLVWGATDLGAFKLANLDVSVLDAEVGLLDDEVTAIAELPGERIVLGHHGGLTVLEGSACELVRFADIDPELPAFGRVMDLSVAETGELFIAAAGLGVGHLDRDGRLSWTRVPDSSEHWANCIHRDGAGGALVGTPAGLLHFRDGELTNVDVHAGADPFVRRIEIGAEGALYLASTVGLWVRRDREWRHLRSIPDLTVPNHFYAVLEDRAGRVWVGGFDGLWLVAGDALVRAGDAYDVKRPVYSLVEDNWGRLWIGTDFGLAVSDGERLVALDWLAEHTGYESNRAAALTDRAGKVWMGTTRGVTVFAPSFEVDPGPLAVELLAVEVGAKPTSLDAASVRLAAGRSDLLFRARALSLIDEERIRFRSRVAGFTDWKTSLHSTILEERFTGLPAGRYRFEVQAQKPGGTFGAVVASPWLHVAGPVWTRWWFLLIAGAGVASVSLLFQRAVTESRTARRLEEEIGSRTRELEASLHELSKTERMRSLSVLAGGIAHDFRNVLTALTGNLSILREECPEQSEAARALDAADQALNRATQLSTQLQTFATGGDPVKRALSVAEIASDCAGLVLSGSNVRASLELPEDLWDAEADPAQIHQVFENLLLNARQCQADGGWVRVRGKNVEITAGARGAELTAGRYVELTVTDGGPGMPADVQRHVFDPFFTTKDQGTGLGLATARSVVQRHDGLLSVASEPGRGATFRVLLPASVSRRTEAEPPSLPARGHASGRVLVVDDEPAIRDLLCRMLGRIGYEADAARDGEEAVRRVSEGVGRGRPYHFAIVDLTLRGGPQGPQILQRLRDVDARLRAAASSGYCDDPVLARHYDYGFQAALPKPYRIDDVERAMQALATGGAPRETPSDSGRSG